MTPTIVDCRFQRFSCGHDLFQTTYTRSNRTRGAKIMRCFPHCCPEHMPRCYCGCSLQLLVTFDDLRGVRLNELIVCARFETSEMQEPRYVAHVGDSLLIPTAMLSTNADDVHATTWIPAEKESEVKQREVAKNSVLYILNNHRFPRWYYGYESGATKNQREMKHHLTAYVFQRPRHMFASSSSSSSENDMQKVEIVARLPSPAFMIVSYRRARGDVKNPVIPQRDDPLAALEQHPSSAEEAEEEEEEDHVDEEQKKADTPPQTHRVAVAKAIQQRESSGFVGATGTGPPATPPSETRRPDTPVSALANELLSKRRAGSNPHSTDSPVVVPPTRRSDAVRTEIASPASFAVAGTPERKLNRHEHAIKQEPRRRHPQEIHHRKRKADSATDTKALWWRLYAQDAQRILHLHVLYVLLDRLALHDVMFCLREKSERLRDKWFDTIASFQSEQSGSRADGGGLFGRTRLGELARMFCLSVFAEDPVARRRGTDEDALALHADSREVLSTCLDVLLDAVTSQGVQQLLAAIWKTHQSTVLESDQIRKLFISFVRRLYTALDALVRSRRKAAHPQDRNAGGLAALVDEVVSTIFREKRLVPLRRDVVHLLGDSEGAAEQWYETFVAQMRVAWVQHDARKVSESGISLLWQAALVRSSPWKGKWLLDATSFRVRRPGGWFHQQQSTTPAVAPVGSIVGWMKVLRQWMAVELAMDGVTLSATSLLVRGAPANMRLVLDERQRIFTCFPDGFASCIGNGSGSAWCHGDYVGRGSDESNEILCETYSMRQTARHAEILRMSVKASIWSALDTAKRCVVAVQLASTTCDQYKAEQLLTWPVAARYRLYGAAKWDVVADIEATYHDLK